MNLQAKWTRPSLEGCRPHSQPLIFSLIASIAPERIYYRTDSAVPIPNIVMKCSDAPHGLHELQDLHAFQNA